jgi:hypothetical protein
MTRKWGVFVRFIAPLTSKFATYLSSGKERIHIEGVKNPFERRDEDIGW